MIYGAIGLLLTDFFHEMHLWLQPPFVATSSRMESFQSSQQSPEFERLIFHSLGIEFPFGKNNLVQVVQMRCSYFHCVLHRIIAVAESFCSLLCKRHRAFYLRGSATKFWRGRFLFLKHLDGQVIVLLLDWVLCIVCFYEDKQRPDFLSLTAPCHLRQQGPEQEISKKICCHSLVHAV